MSASDRTSSANPWLPALALALGAAVSLGITRFSYGLLLPAMRDDLGWSYALAGAMNTANALGYLIGALMTPWLMRRVGAYAALMAGVVCAGVFMLLSGLAVDAEILLAQRVLAGIASAWAFIAGGLMASRLAAAHPHRAGLLLGIYYGGTGIGIVLSALGVPASMDWAATHDAAHGWQSAWLALGLACFVAAALMLGPARRVPMLASSAAYGTPMPYGRFAPALLGYVMFGVGYIGYMTFVIAWLKQTGLSAPTITAFYMLLGCGVMASSRLWARLLDRHRDGRPLALLNGLLGIATLLPAILPVSPLGTVGVFVSGALFGSVFLSVVASTTALVRHNLPSSAWPGGIGAFTTIFALGQIVGPAIVGWIADGPGGLRNGLLFSGAALLVGAALASRQKALV